MICFQLGATLPKGLFPIVGAAVAVARDGDTLLSHNAGEPAQ